MAYGEKEMTEHEEHLLAVKIAKIIAQEGSSYNRAVRVLNEAQNELAKMPITEC